MSISIKNVFRNKGRSIYTIVGIAIAISVIIAIQSATNGIQTNLLSMLVNHRGDVMVMEADALVLNNSKLPLSLADKIAAIPNVIHAEPYTLKNVFVSLGDFNEPRLKKFLTKVDNKEQNTATKIDKLKLPRVPLSVLGMRAESVVFDQYELIAGEKRFSSDSANEIILGAALIKQLQRALDKFFASDEIPDRIKRIMRVKLKRDKLGLPKLSIAGETFVIRGAIKTGTWQDLHIIIPLNTFQRLFEIEGSAHAFMIFIDDNGDVEAVAKQIREFDGPKQLWADRPEKFMAEFTGQLEDIEKIILATSLLASLIGALSVLNTMASNVFERSKEIGLLLAVGWSKSMIVKLIIFEGVILATIGGILAIGLSVLELELMAWIVGVDPVPQGDQAAILIKGLYIAVAVGFIGSIIPALRASRLEPVDALRSE